MRGQVRRTSSICLMLLCMGVCFGCASGQNAVDKMDIAEEQESEQSSFQEEQKTEEQEPAEQETETYSPERQMKKNEDLFFEKAGKLELDQSEAERYLRVLTEDNIFENGTMELTGLRIDDIDGNGQKDMLVTVMDAQAKLLYGLSFYGFGNLWIYINEDEPYCFSEEQCPYFGCDSVFWEDIDNDGNIEIVYSSQGTGCGAAGDSYKAVFKYRNHAIEQMTLPSDFDEDYDHGLAIDVFQEPETDSYSAYCPYFDEWISFRAENIEGWDLPQTMEEVGGNARGFYNLQAVEYEGKNVMQASEYLYGEGGTMHCVAIAQFLITWETDGTPKVIKWWIEDFYLPADSL